MLPMPGGGHLPVDVRPDPAGNVCVDLDLFGWPWAQVLTDEGRRLALAEGRRLYTSHWATCPNADEFRQPRT